MPFDITNPANLAALKSELENDPVSQGYRSPDDLYAVGALSALLTKLRSPDAGGATNQNTEFSGDDLLDAVMASPAELDTAVFAHARAAQRQVWFQRLVDHGADPIPARFHASILSVFSQTDAPTIRAAIIAEATGPRRREEVLFGDDTVLGKADVRAALDYTP